MQLSQSNNSFSQQTIAKKRSRQDHAHDLTGQCLVLRYYRVAQLIHDPQHLAVEPYAFESQMQYLAENFDVISLTELKQHLDTSNPFKERTAAVTFDIGYSDLLYTARPIIEKYRIPATVFAVSAGMLGAGQLWFDYLEDYLLAASLPDEIDIESDDGKICLTVRNQYERFCAYEKLYQQLRRNSAEQQNQILEQLKSVAVLNDSELDSHCLLDNQELQTVAESELISIGGCTHNCLDLQYLNATEQQQEIYRNKAILEQVLDTTLEFFAQPFDSSAGECAEQTENLIRQTGYSMTMGNSYGTINISENKDCCELARVKAGNRNDFAFHQFLERFII